jgi:hypothetical protein
MLDAGKLKGVTFSGVYVVTEYDRLHFRVFDELPKGLKGIASLNQLN